MTSKRFGVIRWWVLATSMLCFFGCGSRVTDDTGTETHWLKKCSSDVECSVGLSCLCNVCTRGCEPTEGCPNQAPHCVASESLECEDARAAAVCYSKSEQDLIGKGDAGAETPLAHFEIPALDDARPNPEWCDSLRWCWESPGAPGERFFAFSADRRFAVGERGVVFSMSDGYLPLLSVADLTSVIVIDGRPWVGSHEGVWSFVGRGWARQSDVGVSALAVTRDGEVWALRGDTVARFDGTVWIATAPTPKRKEMLVFHDLTANADGTVTVVGTYFIDKTTHEGVLFTWDGKSWTEQAAGFATGTVRFLEGPATPYVYHVPNDGDDTTARVYEPARNWRIVAERESSAGGTVFWGPDDNWWLANPGAVFSFEEPSSKVPDGVTCAAAINWDRRTVLCADERGGLNFITALTDGSIVAAPGWPTFPPHLPETFETQPTPVWAHRNEAWGVSATDVWRAPLEHYDGSRWEDGRAKGDTFVARSIEGTASDDVWFAGDTELRRWDGTELSNIELLAPTGAQRILDVRIVDASHRWILLENVAAPFRAAIAAGAGDGWVLEYEMELEQPRWHGSLAGASEDSMWATLGHQVLRRTEAGWSIVAELQASEAVLDAVSDDDTLWLVSDNYLYWLQGTDDLALAAYRTGGLQRLALTRTYVWNFDGPYVRKLAR